MGSKTKGISKREQRRAFIRDEKKRRSVRSQFPSEIQYGGEVWVPEIARVVTVPVKMYSVVDYTADNLGSGFIVRITGGLDAVINDHDLVAYNGGDPDIVEEEEGHEER